MQLLKNFSSSDNEILISGKSPITGTSGTAIKNLNTLDNLINYDTFVPGTISLSSSNQLNDIATGTGVRQIIVYGLQAVTFQLISEIITLHASDGRTAVTSTNSFYRVFAAEIYLAGSGMSNVGDIYIYTTGTALTAGVPTALTTTWLKILAGECLGTNGLYTVPKNKKASISNLMLHTRTQIAEFSLWVTDPNSNCRTNIFRIGLPATTPVLESDILKFTYEFNELTDIYLRATPITTLAIVTAHMTLSLKDK